MGAYALSETNAGSDAFALETRAVRDAGDYVCTREPIDTTWIPDISDDGVQITDSAWRPIGSNRLNRYRYVSGLSGGTFLIYGNTYSAVSIGSNGYVMFGGNSGASVEEASGFIPSLDLPNNAIYAYGDALLADSADGGAVYYLNVPGTTCNVDRNGDGQLDLCMIVQWESLPNQLDPAAFASVSESAAVCARDNQPAPLK